MSNSFFSVVSSWMVLFRFVECEINWDRNIKEFSSCFVNRFKNVLNSFRAWPLRGLPKMIGMILMFSVMSLIKFSAISILWSFSIILSSLVVNLKFFMTFTMSKLISIVLLKILQVS